LRLKPASEPSGWFAYITENRFIVPASRLYLGNKIKTLAKAIYNNLKNGEYQ
jgi:hypothetical protein